MKISKTTTKSKKTRISIPFGFMTVIVTRKSEGKAQIKTLDIMAKKQLFTHIV